jgi:hypothetical protein
MRLLLQRLARVYQSFLERQRLLAAAIASSSSSSSSSSSDKKVEQ